MRALAWDASLDRLSSTDSSASAGRLLLDSIIASLGILVLGYACWAAAQDAWLVSAGNALRAAGSAIIWIRSTVLLQLNCDQRYLGRLSAIEMALYTIAESITSFGTGLALDLAVLGFKVLMCDKSLCELFEVLSPKLQHFPGIGIEFVLDVRWVDEINVSIGVGRPHLVDESIERTDKLGLRLHCWW